MTNQQQRQSLGCGYEPKHPTLPVMMWSPPGSKCGYSGPRATVCPGYSTNLPEIIETAIIRRHWEKGSIVAACGGENPTEEQLAMVLVLDGAFADLKHWACTPSKDGGGGA
jgi:hypothetical protein